MTCRDFVERVWCYLDGEQPDARRATLDRHRARCADCAGYLESYRATVRLARAAFDENGAAPADVPEELLRAILGARSG